MMAMVRDSAELLEREQELAALAQAWRQAREGRGSAWLVCAEAGGGKTRLVQALAALVAQSSGAVYWGGAEPVAPAEPYLALTNAIPDFAPAPTRSASVLDAVAWLQALPSPLLLVLDAVQRGQYDAAGTRAELPPRTGASADRCAGAPAAHGTTAPATPAATAAADRGAIAAAQHGASAAARHGANDAHASEAEDVLCCAMVLRELRAGTLAQAQTLLDAAKGGATIRGRVLMRIAELELMQLLRDPLLMETAARSYERFLSRRYARPAGVAALALVRAGAPPPQPPDWLAADSPLRLYRDWAAGIAGNDAARLREVAAQLEALQLPYEAALALGDAGDHDAAYRRLSALGCTEPRRLAAAALRAAGRPIPRRTRAAVASDGLTETEREVCRLVAAGGKNEAIAAQLVVSVRTVESHLANIYDKLGRRGRVALAAWWLEQGEG